MTNEDKMVRDLQRKYKETTLKKPMKVNKFEYLTCKFEYLTCKNTLNVGLRRLLLVLSSPLFLWIIPGILFWVIIHAIIWIYEGYVSDDKKPPIEGNNFFSPKKN